MLGFIISFVDRGNNMNTIKKETYKIVGMHCASCVKTIEQALAKTKGVHSVSVNFASESALIEFDQDIISESDLVKIVQSLNYKLIVEKEKKPDLVVDKGDQIVLLKVVGMDSCFATL